MKRKQIRKFIKLRFYILRCSYYNINKLELNVASGIEFIENKSKINNFDK